MASSSSSSKRARIRFYNPKPLSQAPPNSDPFKSCTPFISDEIFDERKPIPPGDPKRPPELPSNWIMEEHVRKGGKYIGRKYMVHVLHADLFSHASLKYHIAKLPIWLLLSM